MRILKKKIGKIELARLALVANPTLNKSLLARHLAISRDCLYEKLKQHTKDQEFKDIMLELMNQEPYYGHRRLAYHLNCNPKKTYRIMKLFGLRCRFRRKRFKYTKDQPNSDIPNILENQKPTKPNQYWSGDFTYIPYKGKFIYLAIQKDLFTREAVGVNVHFKHTQELVGQAMNQALNQYTSPELSHSDQGREYTSQDYQNLLTQNNIQCSMSHKASPWENGYSEGFFSTFKLEFGNPGRFEHEAELISAIYRWIDYYNHKRIHTAIKTSPMKFKQKWSLRNQDQET